MRSKVSELLEKINRLAERTSHLDFSNLERDLLKHYLVELYDEVIEKEAGITINTEPEKVIEKANHTPAEVVVEKHEPAEVKTEVPPVMKPKVDNKSSLNEIIEPAATLHSKLKAESVKEVHHRLSAKPLKELIDLNKRFAIINELFMGNKEAFGKTVERVDTLKNFSEAENYLHNEVMNAYKWNETSAATQLFWELVKQRFSNG